MKNQLVAFFGIVAFVSTAFSQTSSFTYQGRFLDGGVPASGNYDMRFTLHDTLALTNQVGPTILLAPATPSNGLFTATLDFGSASFNGGPRWLQIGVKPFGDTNAFVLLSPRQQITSAPYSIQALNAASAATATKLSVPLPGTNVVGTIPLSNLPPNIALLNSNAVFTANVTAPQFNGSGAGLFNIPAAGLTGTIPDARLSTNVALLNANATFSGTVTATNFSGHGGGLTNVPGRIFDNVPVGSPTFAQPNTGYLATNDSSAVVVTLPQSAALRVGETVRVSGGGYGGWIIAQHADQTILVSSLLQDVGLGFVQRDIVRNWRAVASSADGTKLVAAVNPGFIYNSTNSGATWTQRDSSRNWISVASSASGAKMVAAVSGGQLYTSTDFGTSWSPRDANRNWVSVASSVDGSLLVAAVANGQLYTSVNSGANWTARESARNWKAVASSANGSNLVAAVQGGQIYTSTNAGANWTLRAFIQGWSSVASSADGSLLLACANGERVHLSTDSGATWVPTSLPTAQWTSVTASADGSRLAAAYTLGGIYLSKDSGATWFISPGTTSTTIAWTGLAASGDGNALVAVANASQIYVSGKANTTPGTAGYLIGTRLSAVELVYLGNGQFMPVNQLGTIRAH